jgi:2-polyprenyl-3-methyl-5-hydroxy-6-metoxy-1,4-benzoquinol methylase
MKVLQGRPVSEANENESVRQRLYARYSSLQDTDPETELRQRRPYLQRLIRKHFPENRTAKILDLGCGAGALLCCLKEAGYEQAEGVDASLEQVKLARQRGLDVNHSDLFLFLETGQSGAYDLITSFDVLEHLEKHELLQLADEVYRVLAPNGVWLIHTANAEGIFGNRIRCADLTHEQAFTRESLAQLAAVAGFRSCHSFEDRPVVHGVASMLRWFVWRIGRTLLGMYFTAETGERARHAILSQNLLAVVRK